MANIVSIFGFIHNAKMIDKSIVLSLWFPIRRHPGRSIAVVLLCLLAAWFLWPPVLFDASYSTVILDRDGDLLGASIARDEQWRFPPDTGVPAKFIQAITTFEDHWFFYHPGIDPVALVRAMWSNLRERRVVSGASTLTMQVIRLSRAGKPRTVFEKLVEMVYALRLECTHSKQEILQLYAAHAPFGGNVVGLEAAAWRYFGRGAEKLSWAETAMLAVLPNTPALIHPGRNRNRLLNKRNALLEQMRQRDILDSLSCRLAKQEPLPPRPHPIPMLAPHLLASIRRSIAQNPSGNPTTRQRTTLRKDIQINATHIIERRHRHLARNDIHNAAAIILEVDTGHIVAYVGNVSGKGHGNYVDIITAPRSTGSILKPMLYAGMLQSGDILPSMLVPDIPLRLGGFAPQNYSKSYQGAVPASMALARSMNVPAVRMLHTYGVDRFYTFLKKMGVTTLHRSANDYGLSLILGGAEGSLWDLTGIYAGMARQVNRYLSDEAFDSPAFFPPVWHARDTGTDSNGKNARIDAPLDAGASWLTLQAMLEVVRPDVENAWRNFLSSHKIAWKTGTSQGFRDAWAIGVTPRYAVGVWVGNADGEGRPGLIGVQVAAPILFELFGLLDRGRWFACPEGDLVEIEVCAQSGYRAGPYCSDTKQNAVPEAGRQTPRCPYCMLVHCDASLTYRVHGDCERVSDIRPVQWFVLPTAMEWYYMKRHAGYHPLPPYRGDCLESMDQTGASSLSLIYPDEDGRIYVPLELDGIQGRTVFQAAHRSPGVTIYWHLNETYLGATRDIHQMSLAPKPGRHTLSLVDQYGESLSRTFTILAKE